MKFLYILQSVFPLHFWIQNTILTFRPAQLTLLPIPMERQVHVSLTPLFWSGAEVLYTTCVTSHSSMGLTRRYYCSFSVISIIKYTLWYWYHKSLIPQLPAQDFGTWQCDNSWSGYQPVMCLELCHKSELLVNWQLEPLVSGHCEQAFPL